MATIELKSICEIYYDPKTLPKNIFQSAMKNAIFLTCSMAFCLINLFSLFGDSQAYLMLKKTRILPPMFAPAGKRNNDGNDYPPPDFNNVQEYDQQQQNGEMTDSENSYAPPVQAEKRYNPYPLPPFLLGRQRNQAKNNQYQRTARRPPGKLPVMKRSWGGHYD